MTHEDVHLDNEGDAERKECLAHSAAEHERNSQFWSERFGTSDCVRNYHFYAYEYLDDLSFMRPARDAFADWEHAEAVIERVEKRFQRIGWEGDGLMQLLWLPPFAGAGDHDNYGCYVLHVKQDNNGVSWLASPVPLPFHRLYQHDCAQYPKPTAECPAGIAGGDAETGWLKEIWAD